MTDNSDNSEKSSFSELVKETWHLVSRDIVAYLFPLESESEDDPDRFAGATIKEREAKRLVGKQLLPAISGYRKPLIVKGRRVAKIVPVGLFAAGLIILGIIVAVALASA